MASNTKRAAEGDDGTLAAAPLIVFHLTHDTGSSKHLNGTLDGVIELYDKTISDYAQLKEASEREIASLEAQIAGFEAQIASLEAQIASLGAQIASLEA